MADRGQRRSLPCSHELRGTNDEWYGVVPSGSREPPSLSQPHLPFLRSHLRPRSLPPAAAYFATDAGARVGFGTTSPWGMLSINPNGITGPSFVIGSSTATKFIVTNGGNIGIGTTSPQYALDVNGDVNVASGKCFRVKGVCIGYTVKLAAIYATSTPGTNVSVVFGTGGPTFSNGTLTLPASTTQMVVEAWGGGGGGGGGANAANWGGGGGGGGGGYTQKLITNPSGTYSYTVGAGGSAGSAGSGGAEAMVLPEATRASVRMRRLATAWPQ